jgi:beta-glucosidase
MAELPAYKNEKLSFEERAKDLVSRMTLEEKISQMMHSAIEIKRLDIPSYNWWNEALHGVARSGVATMFPQVIGMAASFDEDMMEKVGSIISDEGRAKYHEYQRKGDHGIYKGLTFWAPNINIFRDPRWGRGHETYGEDPYLTGKLGAAFIRGIQGKDKKYLKAAACVKHFAVHSGPESERHRFNALVTQKDLRETYLPAFKECIKEAKVAGVMGAYNRVNGEPCCGSQTLLVKILRQEWGFDGYVTSDCWAIKDFNEGHKVTKDAAESAALAVKAGCDLNCGCAYGNLIDAYNRGLISEEDIDKAAMHLMTIRMRLGMFDDPKHVPYTSIKYENNDCKEHREFSREVARKSFVLLKNQDNLLPLDKNKIRSIAVIGPNADSRAALKGNYYGTASEYVTILQGIREAAGEDIRIYYAEGCHLYKQSSTDLDAPKDRFAEAISAAQRADVTVLCLGLDATIEGEEGDTSNEFSGGDRKNLNLLGLQQELMEAVYAAGKPVILVLLSGSALTINWADEHIPAIIEAWYPGGQGGRALASMIFGEYSPSGRLPITFYKTTKELPDFHDYSMENRTYRYMKNEALYPFGYGLSYSKFSYGNIRISSERINPGESIEVKAKIKNIGSFESDEIAELYLKDIEASVRVPRWQLTGIHRVHLKPQEETEICFTITPRQMALIDEDGNCILEPGKFEVFVGGSQPDSRSLYLTGTPVASAFFNVEGKAKQLPY